MMITEHELAAKSASRSETMPAQNSGGGDLACDLTSDEARTLLAKCGPNAMPDTAIQPWRMALAKFWAPVPWMLEAAIILQTVLHEYVEAAVIAGLLVFNAALGFLQEGRTQATLAALRSRLALSASVKRDGVWKNIPAAELVPGDTVKVSLGGVVAADVRLIEGSILLDHSMLTANLSRSKLERGCKRMRGRWPGAGKPLRSSPRRERRQSLKR